MSAGWSVTYETATIQAGTAPTKAEAERIAAYEAADNMALFVAVFGRDLMARTDLEGNER